jgi:hypothetical protein
MKIEIKDEENKLVITNEEFDNDNFVDLVIYGTPDKENDTGYITEITMPIDELISAITAFKTLKDEREEM